MKKRAIDEVDRMVAFIKDDECRRAHIILHFDGKTDAFEANKCRNPNFYCDHCHRIHDERA